MFLAPLSAKFAELFACWGYLFSCLMKQIWVDVSWVYGFSSFSLCSQ
jgi:hypothetical protein